MKNNYVLIDYENVQPKSLSLLEDHDFNVIVFVGSNQTKMPYELVEAMQGLGNKARYIKIGGNGPNALDFHIAFYIGKIAEQDCDAYFHIISRDTGFDPLIRHLKENRIFAQREKDLAEIPLVRISNVKTADEKIEAVVERLSALGQSRPRKLKTLKNTINALFAKRLGDSELESLVEAMQQRKLILVENEKVAYRPPISHP